MALLIASSASTEQWILTGGRFSSSTICEFLMASASSTVLPLIHSVASDELAHSSIRFGLGRFTTEEEVDYVADLVVEKVTRLRELSPLWEMHNEGIDLKSVAWVAH